jgi:NAD(P)-dependent dehydrogenase (short-subunit alcohol dehydrogenase family)
VAAIELAQRRIRVNCVAAGAFRSPMHERIVKRMPSGEDAYAAKHPLGIGPVEAVRDAVLHLLSDASRWTTGTTVVVDGGYLA